MTNSENYQVIFTTTAGDAKPLIDALTDKAEMLEDSGFLDEALEAWREALRHHATPYLLYRLGSLALQRGEWSEAEKSLLSAAEIARDFAAPHVRLGILYIERGHYEKAQEFLKNALQLEETAATYTLRAVAQRRLGMPREAIDSLHKAIEIDRGYEEAYYNLGVILATEMPQKAIELLDTALGLDQQYEDAHRELGWILRRLERYEEGETHLKRAVELDASDVWAYVYLGNLQWARKDLAAAERTFKRALEVSPNESMTHWCLAMFYQYNDRKQEAEFFYDSAVRLESDDPQANFRFGMFLKELKQNDKACVHLERALQEDPENQEVRDALAALQ